MLRGVDADLLEILDPANKPPALLNKVKAALKNGISLVATQFGLEAAPQAEPIPDTEARRARRLVGAIKRSLSVWREGQSYLIFISVETEDPRLSMVLANTLVDLYIRKKNQDRTRSIRKATQSLAKRADAFRGDVEQAEAAVEDFRVAQLATEGLSQSTIEQQLLELSSQLALSRVTLSEARARHDQIAAVITDHGMDAAADLLSSTLILSLRQRLSDLRHEQAELATEYLPDHVERRRLSAQIAVVSQELRREVENVIGILANEVSVAQSRVQTLQDSLTGMENRAAALSRANIELRQLEREAESVRVIYQSMLDRLNQTRSAEQFQRADARRVERALLPLSQSAPNVTLMTAFGLAVGLSLGLGLTFFAILSGVGFTRSSEIEKATGLPVQASLLRGKWRSPRDMLARLKQAPYHGAAEKLRQLRTAMALSGPATSGGRCVLVTSAVAHEAKTSTALSLALIESLSKRRCIVVDFDLRKSELRAALGDATGSDLGDVLLARRAARDGDPTSAGIWVRSFDPFRRDAPAYRSDRTRAAAKPLRGSAPPLRSDLDRFSPGAAGVGHAPPRSPGRSRAAVDPPA